MKRDTADPHSFALTPPPLSPSLFSACLYLPPTFYYLLCLPQVPHCLNTFDYITRNSSLYTTYTDLNIKVLLLIDTGLIIVKILERLLSFDSYLFTCNKSRITIFNNIRQIWSVYIDDAAAAKRNSCLYI